VEKVSSAQRVQKGSEDSVGLKDLPPHCLLPALPSCHHRSKLIDIFFLIQHHLSHSISTAQGKEVSVKMGMKGMKRLRIKNIKKGGRREEEKEGRNEENEERRRPWLPHTTFKQESFLTFCVFLSCSEVSR
jgi:hypothetical protein